MYTWIIIAVAAIAGCMALFRIALRGKENSGEAFRRRKGVPSVFGTDSDSAADANVASAPLMNIAAEDRHATASPVQTPTAAAAQGSPTVARVSGNSTWGDRKLFSGFRGILNDDGNGLASIEPEQLPMNEDQMVFGSLTPGLAELLPETKARRETQRQNLLAAGFQSRAAWINLNAIRFSLVFLSIVVVLIWLNMAPPALEPWLMAALIAAPLLAWAVPPLWVSAKAADRRIDIERGLPDVMDMLNMGVSQGLTVPSALRRVGHELSSSQPALASELKMVNQQTAVGSLSQALKNFAKRIDSPEVSSFTSLLIQSEATGTSVTRALSEYSDSMRNSLRERADSRANAASFKLLFPVALCLMPSVFLFLLGPAIVNVNDFLDNTANQLMNDRSDALDSLDVQPYSRNGSI
ncbi:MAG: type II secretion system F family protein [Planctomycetaceae bacterium]